MAITLPSSIGGFARAAQLGAFNSAYGRVQQQDDPSGVLPAEAEIGPAVVNHVRGVGSASESDAATTESSVAAAEAAGATGESAAEGGEAAGSTKPGSEEEENAEKIREMKKRDAEVRAHEQAHAAAGGAHAGSPSYSYERGPDGVSYAVSGEVPIDVSPISGDPEATIQKMLQVKRAALAPSDPSDADHAIASTADAHIAAARQEQHKELTEPAEESASASTEAEAGVAAAELFSALERRSAGVAAYGSASAA